MKTTFKIPLVCLIATTLFACSPRQPEEQNATDETQETERLEDVGELPELSVYNLPSTWQTQEGDTLLLEDLRGKVVVVVMIYTSCQAACPRLVADMRNIDQQVPETLDDQVQYVFVSIDPEVDTPERMGAFAKENQMEDDRWLFLRGSEEDTREFAAVLAVGYRRISPIDFSHSNIISVFNRDGVLQYQREGLGTDDSGTIQAIIDLAEKKYI
ncbi:MAG TPA: SCO family protein [Cryomorphaceae bacterium]|nr:SCO family protein [Cryomorphaceae bacterium]